MTRIMSASRIVERRCAITKLVLPFIRLSKDNIRYGKLDATHEEVVEAANAAYVHHFVQTLPGGYNMELNEEESNVSQGQKQLLTIARATLPHKRCPCSEMLRPYALLSNWEL